MRFWKGQALGNDYIVVDGRGEGPPAHGVIRAMCDRHRGVGGDGILVAGEGDPVGLRIFNPDGTEAEKSGNGLRIFGAWLQVTGQAGAEPFQVRLPGETIEMQVEGEGAPGFVMIRVAMGRASFRAGDVHFTAAPAADEVMGAVLSLRARGADEERGAGEERGANEERRAGAEGVEEVGIHLVSMGNPHCVVFREALSEADLRRLGPRIQAQPEFSEGVNVQLARVVTPGRIEAMIWERGAGETLASGSSACAVAAAARRSGRAHGDEFVVSMPGGEVEVSFTPEYDVRLRGEAGIVYEGTVREQVLEGWRGQVRS